MLVDKLLTTKYTRGALIGCIYELIITHHRESLIGDASQIASLVKADVVFFGRLHQLRLVHNLTNLLFEQAMWLDSWSICNSAITARDRGTFLGRVLLFSITAFPAGVLFESSCLSFLAIREQIVMLNIGIVVALYLKSTSTFVKEFLLVQLRRQ